MDQGPAVAIPAHNLPTKGDGCEFSTPFYFPPPTIPNLFSQHFFQLNCYSVGCASHPPSGNKGNEGLSRPYLAVTCLQKASTESFSLILIFPPPFQTCSHSTFFQLNCYSVGRAGHPPSVSKGNKAPPLPFPPMACLQKASTESFPLLLFSPHHSIIFSHHLFPINC
jgi:hypothetical protein